MPFYGPCIYYTVHGAFGSTAVAEHTSTIPQNDIGHVCIIQLEGVFGKAVPWARRGRPVSALCLDVAAQQKAALKIFNVGSVVAQNVLEFLMSYEQLKNRAAYDSTVLPLLMGNNTAELFAEAPAAKVEAMSAVALDVAGLLQPLGRTRP